MRHGLLAVAGVAIVALSIVATARAVPAALPDADPSETVGALAAQLVTELDPDVSYLVDWTDAEVWGAVGTGLFVELEHRGYDVSVVPPRAPTFGEWRTARPEDVDATVLVIGSSDTAPGVDPPPGAVEVAQAESSRRGALRGVPDRWLRTTTVARRKVASMTITRGFNHVATLTTDMDLTVGFYEQAFDAVVTFEFEKRDGHPWMKVVDLGGGAALNVFEVAAEEIIGDRRRQGGRGAIDHYALAVDSRATLEVVKERLIAAGAQEVGEIQQLSDLWSLFFRDPDGMELEVCCPIDGS